LTINTAEKYSVITFATNKLSYVQFALNCAHSVLQHNDVPIFIVSNLDFPIPEKFQDKISVIPAKPGHELLGMGIKLYIDEYVQTEHTLFIDSDCLCFGNLNEIFKACEKMDVTVAGNIVPAENWCGADQAKTIKENFGLDNLIRFNAGILYIKKSQLAKNIFDKAREIAESYDHYGFHRHDNWINEEGLLSIAMMLNKQKPIADDGSYMTDLYTNPRPPVINVLKGTRLLLNPSSPMPYHRPWLPVTYSPLILHFGGNNINAYPYVSQNILLKLYAMQVPATLATVFVNIFIHVPYRCYHWLTGSLRKLKTRL